MKQYESWEDFSDVLHQISLRMKKQSEKAEKEKSMEIATIYLINATILEELATSALHISTTIMNEARGKGRGKVR